MLVASQILEAFLETFSLAFSLLPTYDHPETLFCCFLKLVKNTHRSYSAITFH